MRLIRSVAIVGTLVIPVALLAQSTQATPPAAGTDVGRASERIRALQSEADALAGTARTLLTELRALEVERDLRSAEAAKAETAVTEIQRELRNMDVRLAALEQERVAQLPALETQLVNLYKRGTLGYARVLFGAGDVRDLGRVSRVVAAMVNQDKRRIEEHQKTIAALQMERGARAEQARELETLRTAAVQAKAAAARAVAVHASRLAEIDSRRDLTAQYVGELQVARDALLQQLPASSTSTALPLVAFRGGLDWPVTGRVSGLFGQSANRLGGSVVRNGIEIAAEDGAPVKAIHGGSVAHAGAYPGFGNLVIVDHGANHYSLYGYLGTIAVTMGQTVEAGAEVGAVGPSPAGPDALYFELRVDGHSVDPVQWLKPR
jgi:septal ring factor EnvC (AmiA/AmiB activator)